MTLRDMAEKLRTREDGATAVEYGMILGLITLVVLVGIQALGAVTTDLWNDSATRASAAISKK